MSNLTVGTLLEFLSNFLKIDNNQNLNSNESNVAYGGGMAGNKFDLFSFIKKPNVIFRLVSIVKYFSSICVYFYFGTFYALFKVFAVIVFGCISSDAYYKSGSCPLNDDPNACNFGITIGVVAFSASLLFLFFDAKFESFSNIKTRRRIVVADMIFSSLWTSFWFINFCYLANSWRKTDDDVKEKADSNKIQAAIAFSFFSTLLWVSYI